LFFVFFLCTIQRREISLIYARESPLAAKFCTKTKTKKTPRPLAVLIVENKWVSGGGGGGPGTLLGPNGTCEATDRNDLYNYFLPIPTSFMSWEAGTNSK
jgi:hypothetical protein